MIFYRLRTAADGCGDGDVGDHLVGLRMSAESDCGNLRIS
jgi:hypothetical protein